MKNQRWKIYKAANARGYLPAWYAIYEPLQIGGLFTGPHAFTEAHRFVSGLIRYESARRARPSQ